MKFKIHFISFLLLISIVAYSQKTNNDFSLSLTAGNFSVGHGYIKGIWTGAEIAKGLFLNSKKTSYKLKAAAELYFENGADKATVYNPTIAQFVHDRYYHESNTGLAAKIIYYPFKSFIKGFYIAAGPLLVYSIRTYEKRAQLIEYRPTLSVRMSEIASDNKLLTGYKLTAGYDINICKHWLAGINANFLQYHGRDLNSLLGLKIGFQF